MTFQQLQYLLAVNRNQSFSLAAKEMFVSQSAVSNAITSLEQELGCRIFVRSTQGLTLTSEGRQVVGHAQRIVESHRLMTNSVKFTKPQLRIAAVEYAPARRAFLRLLDENRDRTDIFFSYKDVLDFENRLVRGEIDLALKLSLPQHAERALEEAKRLKFNCRKLTSIPASICIGKGHRFFDKPDLKPEDFAGERLVEAPGMHNPRQGILTAYVPIDQKRILECNNSHLSYDLKAEGYAFAITHMRDKKTREQLGLRYIPIPGLRYSLLVYTDSVRTLTPEAERYLELLQEEIAAATL